MKKKSETINIGLTQCFSIGNYDDLMEDLERELNKNQSSPLDDELKSTDNGLNDTRDNLEVPDNELYENVDEVEEEITEKVHIIQPSNIETQDNAEELENKNDELEDIETPILVLDHRESDELMELSVSNKTLDTWKTYLETPTGITEGVVAKIPIVLSQVIVPITMDFNINLPETLFEIRDIKKNLKVTESTLLHPSDVLFIKGFVRNSIKYSIEEDELTKPLRHYSHDIPFECTGLIDFFRKPREPIPKSQNKFKHLENKGNLNIGFNQISESFVNDPPFCKLLSSRIMELNKIVDKENLFTKIKETIVIELKFEILQNENVVIPSIYNK